MPGETKRKVGDVVYTTIDLADCEEGDDRFLVIEAGVDKVILFKVKPVGVIIFNDYTREKMIELVFDDRDEEKALSEALGELADEEGIAVVEVQT